MSAPLERPTIIRLRPRNQITVPESLAAVLEVVPGDRFLAHVEEGQLVLRKVRRSYFGALAGLWGTQEEIDAEIRAGRDEWDERERRQLGKEPAP
jgi:hypothetical protein